MSRHFITYSGKHFDIDCFSIDNIVIEDIAHALAFICRGNGHYKRFYSVAQHLLNCYWEAKARSYPTNVVNACLLHDASEAYLSDIISDIKSRIPQYSVIENELMDIIYTKFGVSLSKSDASLVKEIDEIVLWYEFVNLHSRPSWSAEPKIYSQMDFMTRPLHEIENAFLDELHIAERMLV